MSGGGGSQQTTTSSGPPPQVLANYQNLVGGAESLLGNPLQQYGGPLVAGFTPDQQAGFSAVENAQGIQNPYINAAAGEFGAATTPLWAQEPQFSSAAIGQYLSPYTADVTQSLQNLYNTQNATQQSQVAGQAASAGAYGGDRSAVAQALTAQQEQLAQAPTLAQTEQTGYQTGLGEFNTEQQQELSANEANAWLGSQAGFGMAGLGTQAQTGALTGASALMSAGALQQQLGQEQLNVPYEQFTAAQAYPYQQLSFLTPIIEGTGSLSGGTGTTTYPGQSALSQVAGLGLTGLGLYGMANNSGLFSSATDSGGSILEDFGGGSDAAGIFGARRGGRISKAIGGPVGLPAVPGIGNGVLPVNLSYIPQQGPSIAGNSAMGLSINQPDVTQTTTSSGGGGGLSDLLGVASLGLKVASLFAKGGHVHHDDGGTVIPGQTNLEPQQNKQQGIGLPAVPSISLDHIIHPGPEIKGSGPPKGPNAPAGANNQFGIGNASSLLGEMKQIGGLFGNSSDTSSSGSADGGRIGYDNGGGVPTAVAAQFGGAPPTITGALQQLYQLPLNRLQEMAIQFPPSSQQGQLIQMALRQKQATPGSGTSQPTVTPQAAQQQSQATPGLGTPIQTPGSTAGASSGQGAGGTATAMAEGGTPGGGYVTPDELDPLPVVDHSGDTVKVKYPSEGKELDLGLPSIKRRALAAGGSAGNVFGPSIEAGNGVALPQLNTNTFTIGNLANNDPLTGSAYQPGGGSGNWMQPLPQYQPPGTTSGGPGGSTIFPSTTSYTPGVAGIAAPFGITVGQSLGGSPPGAAGSAGIGSSFQPTAAQIAAANTPGITQDYVDPTAPSGDVGGGTGGGKRGGNVSHFDDGGDVGNADAAAPPLMQQLQEGEAYEIGQHGGLYSPPPAGQDASSRVPATLSQAAATAASGLTAPMVAADVDSKVNTQAARGIGNPVSGGEAMSRGIGSVPRGTATDSGEPSPPQAMATPDRAPPAASNGSPYATGDSHGWGLIAQGGLQGTYSTHHNDPAASQTDATVGRSPREEYDYITSRPKDYWQGKDVVLSTGVANDPSQVGFVPWQLSALKERGANVVGVAGFTKAGAAGTDMTDTARQVSGMAAEANVPFGGIWENNVRPNDPVHLTPTGYQQVGDWFKGAAGAPSGNRSTMSAISVPNTPVSAYIKQAAEARGMDPYAAYYTASTEGGFGQFQIGDSGSSGGPYQLHLDDPAHPGAGKSMGDQFYRDTGLNPLDPKNWQATVDYSLDYAKQHGWDPNIWHGLRRGNVGIGGGDAAHRNGPPGAEGGDQVISDAPGNSRPGIGATPDYALDRTAPYGQERQHHGVSLSDYAMPFLIAGLSTLGSRSPNALAEGFRAAAPYFTASERAQQQEQLGDVRRAAAENNAAVRQSAASEIAQRDAANLQFKYDNLKRLADSNQATLEQKQQLADVKAQLDRAKLAITAGEAAAKMSKPFPGYNAKTGETGNYQWDPDKKEYTFTPGTTVGKPAAVSTYQQMRNAYLQQHPGDQQGALDYAAKTSGFRDSAEYEREVSAMMGHLQQLPAYAAASPEALRGAAEQMVLTSRGNAPKAQQPAPLQPGQAPVPEPAPQQRSQQAPAEAHPAVVQNGWRYEWANGGYQPIAPVQ